MKKAAPYRIAALILGSGMLLSQMPDWKFFKDREGNFYYVDRAGKIRITGQYEENYRPVSGKAIDYYLNLGVELTTSHRIVDGLRILKSVLAISSENNRILRAQEKAAGEINRLMRIHGPRFDRLNMNANLVLYMENNDAVIRDDIMRFAFRVPTEVRVIKKKDRVKRGYRYHGYLFGIRNPDNTNDDAYDSLLAVDCERYSVPIRDMETLEGIWRQKFGYEEMYRKAVDTGSSRAIYQFSMGTGPEYAGYESFFLNRNIGCMARIIAPGSRFLAGKDLMLQITKSITTVEMNRTR